MIAKSFLKYSGSKRTLLPQIQELIPQKFNKYFEPFLGSGICLQIGKGCQKIVGSDIEEPLIQLWNIVKTNPQELIEHYTKLWLDGANKNYYEVRTRYNQTHDGKDLYYLLRTCYQGMTRYNRKGEFNSPYDARANRAGMNPNYVANLIFQWSDFLNKHNVILHASSYEWILDQIDENSFVFLDPPYNSVNKHQLYRPGTFSFDNFLVFLQELNNKGSKFMWTFDGKVGENNQSVEVPTNLYKHHGYFNPVKSSWRKRRPVQESYYINYDI